MHGAESDLIEKFSSAHILIVFKTGYTSSCIVQTHLLQGELQFNYDIKSSAFGMYLYHHLQTSHCHQVYFRQQPFGDRFS